MIKCKCNCHGFVHSPKCCQSRNKQIIKTRSRKNLTCICGTTIKHKGACSGCYPNHPNDPNTELFKDLNKTLGNFLSSL